MSNATFGFLPFVRKGLVKNILLPDEFGSFSTAPAERATITATVKVSTPSPSSPVLPPQTIKLVGPGDVLGISRDVILRSEPANYTFNFEANLLPFVEFYEEDFLWRYSPAKENADNQVRPWLTLLILKDTEYALQSPLGEGLPPFIQLAQNVYNNIGNVLHPNLEHWAWGHVQMNQPAATNPIQDLKQTIEQHPDAAICRLLASRQLSLNTEYTAFLIPTFETGRVAGLGLPTSGINSLMGSWDQTSHVPGYIVPGPGQYPVYYQWRFGTSASGDFESLARKLKPFKLPDAVGTRLMDARNLGMGLEADIIPVPNPLYPGDVSKNGHINLEGALSPAGSAYAAAQTATPSSVSSPTVLDTFTAALKEVLNLQTELQQNPNSTSNVYNLGSNDEDPVILPPLYGQYHADVERVDAGSPMWFQQLNLDLRYRAAAGMGTRVIKDKQEQFMSMAWRQIGEVNAANDKIRKAQLAIQVSKVIYEKHLIGEVASPSTTSSDKFERVLKIASPTLKKIQTGDAGIRSTVNAYLGLTTPAKQLDKVSLKITASTTAITNATVDSGFRKVTRSRSVKLRVADANTDELKQGLEKGLDSNANVTSAKPLSNPVGTQTQTQYATNPVYTASYTGSAAPNAISIANFPANGTTIYNWVQYNRAQFEDFQKTYAYYVQLNNQDNPTRQSLINTSQAHAFRMAVQNNLDPEVSVAGKVMAQIKLKSSSLFNRVKPILAYPVIDLPMVKELVELSIQNLVPNLGEVQNNTVTLFESNDRFIESFMVGLNHEFNRELMWREYPTDRRGTPFRVFWDKKDNIDPAKVEEDISPIHQWAANHSLGTNSYYSSQNIMVLCVRGDLLKKFPNALVYAQKADFGNGPSSPRQLLNATNVDAAFALNANNELEYQSNNSFIKVPVFKIDVAPDVVMLGFELSKDDAMGNPANYPATADAGWFFVFRERPGNIRFGLDAPIDTTVNTLPPVTTKWDALSWNHLDSGGDATQVEVIIQDNGVSLFTVTRENATWDSDAAQNAFILFRNASMVAIHASDMIKDN